jgi:hypothetical protein
MERCRYCAATLVRGGGDAGSIGFAISEGLLACQKCALRFFARTRIGDGNTNAREVTPNFSDSWQQEMAHFVIPSE